MISSKRFIYSPALRMKKGELEGLSLLRDDVANCIIPVLIVPPAKERNSSSQESLFGCGKSVPDVGGILGRYWAHRQAFVDPRALFKEYGADKATNWLPTLFRHTRSCGVFAIPFASLATLEKMGVEAFKASISVSDELKFGLRIPFGDMTDPMLASKVQLLLQSMGLNAPDCAVFTDFSDADLSDPSLVAPIIRAALEQLQILGRWQLIVFLGTHFPTKNPAESGQTFFQPRNEWLAWTKAVDFDPSTAEHMLFGDFAADNAKIDFKAGRARPIRHCRYTTASNWLVVRGEEEGTSFKVMKDVFKRIVNSSEFSGPTFSKADAYIYDVANNIAPSAGNPTTWRQINTTHHITRVVADIASVRKIPISTLPIRPIGVQQSLLDV